MPITKSVESDVIQYRVTEGDGSSFDYIIEARHYSAEQYLGIEQWQIGELGSSTSHTVYVDEIDAYIELFNAMKNYKKEVHESDK